MLIAIGSHAQRHSPTFQFHPPAVPRASQQTDQEFPLRITTKSLPIPAASLIVFHLYISHDSFDTSIHLFPSWHNGSRWRVSSLRPDGPTPARICRCSTHSRHLQLLPRRLVREEHPHPDM